MTNIQRGHVILSREQVVYAATPALVTQDRANDGYCSGRRRVANPEKVLHSLASELSYIKG
jgi:hypothetical protein